MQKENNTATGQANAKGGRMARFKAFWTTKRFLFLAIILSVVCTFGFYIFCLATLRFNTYDLKPVVYLIIFETVFIFLCLIIYYLAIIANSLRYGKHGKDGANKEQK